MADPDESVVYMVDAMPLDPRVVYVPGEVPVIEQVRANDELYSVEHETHGVYTRRNGAVWFAFTPARICGWVSPRRDLDGRDLEDYLAVTTCPDGYPLDLGPSPEDRGRFCSSGVGNPSRFVPCQVCRDLSWPEGSTPEYYKCDSKYFKCPEKEPWVYYDPSDYRIITPCPECNRKMNRDWRYLEQYHTLTPTVQQVLRFHLRGKGGWNEGWLFLARWGLNHDGSPGSLAIGNCEQCGVAGRLEIKCHDCYGAFRKPIVNRAGLVVHPCIVAYFCGHANPDWSEYGEWVESDTEGPGDDESDEGPCGAPKKKDKPVVYLYHYLDFGWCNSQRGTYKNFHEDGHPKYPRRMLSKDIALFKMVDEYDGGQYHY